MNKKHIIASITVALALSVTANAASPDVVRIGYQTVPNGEAYVKAKGWYEKELGVKVELKEFASGRDVNTAIAAGSIDFGQLGTTPTSVGISRGLPYQVIWIHDVIGEAEALAVKNSSNISTFKDLVGKKIAVPISSTAHYSLLNALKLNGIDQKSVKILDLQPQDIFAAWQRGDIDGAYVWDPTLGKLLADGKLLTSSKELAEKGIVTADIEIVRSEFAKKFPEVVTKYVKLQIKANTAFKSNPNEVTATIAKAFNVDSIEGKKQVAGLVWLSGKDEISAKYLGSSKKKGDLVKTLKATADFLVEQKAIDKAADLSAFEAAVNPEFIEKALK